MESLQGALFEGTVYVAVLPEAVFPGLVLPYDRQPLDGALCPGLHAASAVPVIGVIDILQRLITHGAWSLSGTA